MDELEETADVATIVDETDQRRAKLDYWRSRGVDPFGSRFVRTHSSRQIIDGFADLEGKHVSIAGRVMAFRSHGKASFFDIADPAGRIQVYAKHDALGDEQYEMLRQVDIGDIIGVAGEVFRTRRGEISVALSSFAMLSKSLRPCLRSGTVSRMSTSGTGAIRGPDSQPRGARHLHHKDSYRVGHS